MSAPEPIKIENVDVNKLEIRLPTKESKNPNGQLIQVLYNKSKLLAVMPTVKAPWGAGLKKTGDDEKKEKKYSMAISFEGEEENTPLGRKLKRAHEKMIEIDEKIQELLIENKEIVWKDLKDANKDAGKKDARKKSSGGPSDESLRDRYASFLKSKADMPELMYLGMQTKKVNEKEAARYTDEEKEEIQKQFQGMKKYDFLVDSDGNAIDINANNLSEVIPWDSRIKPVIEFSYLWVMKASNQVFPAWTLVHGMLSSDANERRFDITRDDDEEERPREEEAEDRMEEDDQPQDENNEEEPMDEDAHDDEEEGAEA